MKWIPVTSIFVLLVLLSGCVNTPEPAADRTTLKGLEFHTNLSQAFDAAQMHDRPIFVYVRSEYCGWCRVFEDTTFTNSSVIRTLKEHFILVSIDVYRQRSETISLGVRSTPTEIFFDPQGREILRIPGYINTSKFINILNKIAN